MTRSCVSRQLVHVARFESTPDTQSIIAVAGWSACTPVPEINEAPMPSDRSAQALKMWGGEEDALPYSQQGASMCIYTK